jgi:hypothetical protein
VNTDNTVTVPEFSDEERRATRRQLAQQAITLAMQGRWQEAVDLNKQIVDTTPDDAEAHNRLGKAYTELGQIALARAAYEQSLQADPANLIAQRNLDRLSLIKEDEAAEKRARAGSHSLDPRFFMEETGKTGVTTVQSNASRDMLATLTAGDEVKLVRHGSILTITTKDGTQLGQVETALAARLSRLMQTGNEYQVGIVGVEGHVIRIIIRETVQSPQNAGRISFPPRVAQTLPRPYVREGLVRRSGDEEDEDESEVDISDMETDDDEDDPAAFGFHEGTLDEDE